MVDTFQRSVTFLHLTILLVSEIFMCTPKAPE